MAQNNNQNAAAIGLGIAAAAAAAGGAYWLYGAKQSAKHRKMAKSWMLKARAEVMDAIGDLQDIDKEQYMQIVDRVLKNYTGKSGASAAEIGAMMRDFKSAWTHIQGPKKSIKKAAKRTTKAKRSASKRTSKRSSRN